MRGAAGGLFAQAQQMQKKLQKIEQELKETVYTGEAGNGAVKVTVTGAHEVKSVKIDPACVDPDDIEMLEDLLLLAMNNANDTLTRDAKERMAAAMPKIPGLF